MMKYVFVVHVSGVQVLTGQSPGLLSALGGGLILLGVLSLAHEVVLEKVPSEGS